MAATMIHDALAAIAADQKESAERGDCPRCGHSHVEHVEGSCAGMFVTGTFRPAICGCPYVFGAVSPFVNAMFTQSEAMAWVAR